MRITSLDLILGTPRLQRRIDAEMAQLPADIAAVRNSGRQLRHGIAHKATSLPALGVALASGFVVGKIARMPHWRPSAGAITSTLWWQLLMPLVSGLIQAKLASSEPEQTDNVQPENTAPPR